MEHLLYVLWNDEIKPWLKDVATWITGLVLGVLLTLGVFLGIIWIFVLVQQVLNGFYGG